MGKLSMNEVEVAQLVSLVLPAPAAGLQVTPQPLGVKGSTWSAALEGCDAHLTVTVGKVNWRVHAQLADGRLECEFSAPS